MTIQVKLGRWRTRDGSVAIVNEVVEQDPPYRFRGTCNNAIWNWTSIGNIWSRGEDGYDLVEYLGPLEPAPFNLDAFIAGLKPGDYYADQRGVKYCVVAVHDHALWVKADHEKRPFTIARGENSIVGYPAGPWVEPPKAHHMILAWRSTGLWVENGEDSPHDCQFAQRITYTPGKGFELGEVVKQ